jgi:translation initiation factor 2 subunit 1
MAEKKEEKLEKPEKPEKHEDDEIGAGPVAHAQNCRMYENKYPEVDDLVMVRVKSIAEMGAYVSLLEYNNIEGMILLSELSRRRIRSISKLIRVGRQEVCVVLRVDKEKGYIDLSKRRVSPEDIVKCEEHFNKSKTVHSIMKHVAETMHQNLEELYMKLGWSLYRKYGHAFDAFKRTITNAEEIFEGTNLTPELREAFLKNIRRRLSPQPLKLRADLEVTCFRYDGIDAVKDALRAGQAASTVDIPITIKLVAPPLYVMVTQSLDKEKGIAVLQAGVEAIRKTLLERKGELTVKVPPRAISEREDKELTTYMEELERQNMEVSGDDDHDDEEKEGEEEDEGDDEDEKKKPAKPSPAKGKGPAGKKK